jgi:hypothetical protein
VNPRLRRFAAIAVGGALLAQTWLWIGLTGAPIGYTVDLSDSIVARTQFLLGGPVGELGATGTMRIIAGPHHFEQAWPLANGGEVHISEDIAPYPLLLGGGPSYDELIAAVRTRSKWEEATALDGRVNALRARIGRLSISIEGPLSYDELFRIAESLRPGFASLLNL